MSNLHLKKNSKAKKGISPVIATVILVAVAVVIAAALAAFSGSLFGTYQNTAQISVQNSTLLADGSGTLNILNKGGSQDSVVAITVVSTDSFGGTPKPLPANQATPVDFDTGDALNVGQQVTMKIKLGSGQEILQSVTVS